MTTAGWVTMILVVTLVWGGFAFVLQKAIRKESDKSGGR